MIRTGKKLFAAVAGGDARNRWLILGFIWLACTAALFALRPGYTFPPFDVIDSWVYTGYQWNLHGHVADFGYVYYGSRLTLILPGALLHGFLPPLAANVCYKLCESALLSSAMGLIAYRARGLPAAMLAVGLAVLSPQIIWALHTDYMDTTVIIYGALTLAGITLARDSPRWPVWIALAGVAFACLGITNLSAVAMPGLGIAAYHLLWTGWGLRRQIACVGIYLAAVALVLALAGLINLRLGGQFLFLKPQVDMILYFHKADRNPWTPANWQWLKAANWLVVPVASLLWGLVRSFSGPSGEESSPRLVRALTGGLAVSLAVAINMELRGMGVLAYSFYASMHLCLALPLLAVCAAPSGTSRAASVGWTVGIISALTLLVLKLDSLIAARFLQRYVPFHPPAEYLPMIAVAFLLLVAGMLAVVTTLGRRPGPAALVCLGIIACSMPLGFHGPELSDRLPQRYATVHAAFQKLVREYPRGSYLFWLHPDEKNGGSLASTMLYGYRLFTLQPFPAFSDYNASRETLVVPAPPHQAETVLKLAAQSLRKARLDVVRPRIFPIAGDRGTSMELVCFSIAPRPPDLSDLIAEAGRGAVVVNLQFSGPAPYTDAIIQTTFNPELAKTIESSRGYPIFTPTDTRDYLWIPFHPLPAHPQKETLHLSMVAVMPADGDCVCVVQVDGYQEVCRISLKQKGQSLHLIEVPATATELRLYLMTENLRPTALPTGITIYGAP